MGGDVTLTSHLLEATSGVRQVDDAMCRLVVRTSVTRWCLLSSSYVVWLRIAASSEAAITGRHLLH